MHTDTVFSREIRVFEEEVINYERRIECACAM